MTCPNPDLLSALFDGELEPPWSERIDAHVAECGRCQQILAGFRFLKRRLYEDPEPPVEEALARTRDRLDSSLRAPVWHRLRLWRTRISVPLPAIAAMFLVFLGMAAVLVFVKPRSSFPFMSIKQQPSGVTEVQVAAPIEDLQQLLKSLDQGSTNQQIVIDLPADTEFLQFGEPKMLRAEDYGRRVR
jgi:anti-sigma factor RsiW